MRGAVVFVGLLGLAGCSKSAADALDAGDASTVDPMSDGGRAGDGTDATSGGPHFDASCYGAPSCVGHDEVPCTLAGLVALDTCAPSAPWTFQRCDSFTTVSRSFLAPTYAFDTASGALIATTECGKGGCFCFGPAGFDFDDAGCVPFDPCEGGAGDAAGDGASE